MQPDHSVGATIVLILLGLRATTKNVFLVVVVVVTKNNMATIDSIKEMNVENRKVQLKVVFPTHP